MTVDEAHRFFDHDAAAGQSTFALIAREGNRSKLGLCLFTQLPSDLPHEAYANTGITVSFALPSAREREHFARNAPTDIGVLEAECAICPWARRSRPPAACAWRCTRACRGPIWWRGCWSAVSWPRPKARRRGHD
jgi:hypothetical protein